MRWIPQVATQHGDDQKAPISRNVPLNSPPPLLLVALSPPASSFALSSLSFLFDDDDEEVKVKPLLGSFGADGAKPEGAKVFFGAPKAANAFESLHSEREQRSVNTDRECLFI